jgi:hypothetical protein
MLRGILQRAKEQDIQLTPQQIKESSAIYSQCMSSLLELVTHGSGTDNDIVTLAKYGPGREKLLKVADVKQFQRPRRGRPEDCQRGVV